MAITFAIMIKTFIKDAWVPNPLGSVTLDPRISSFEGDNRDFSKEPNASFRTKQYLTFDFNNAGSTWTANADTGTTTQKDYYLKTGQTTYMSAKASPNDLSAQIVIGNKDEIQLRCKCSSANPMVPGAPPIDYDFFVSATRNGVVALSGSHDGFPSYEMYARVNNGGWQNIYQFTQTSMEKLAGEMDVKNVSVRRNIL